MKAFYTLILVLFAGAALGQTEPKTCSDFEIWFWGGNDCIGTQTRHSGAKFIGLFGKKFYLSGTFFGLMGISTKGNSRNIHLLV